MAWIDEFAEDKLAGIFWPQKSKYEIIYTRLSEILPIFCNFQLFVPLNLTRKPYHGS